MDQNYGSAPAGLDLGLGPRAVSVPIRHSCKYIFTNTKNAGQPLQRKFLSENEPVLPSGVEEALLVNAIDFLNGGLELLFAERCSSRKCKLAIVAIQTSIELFAKYRLVRALGAESVVRGKKIPKEDVLSAAQRGELKTLGFNECIKEINRIEELSEEDSDLIRELQYLRNSLVHFSAEISVDAVRKTCAWLLIRILAMFAAGDARDIGEFQDYRRYLDQDNFSKLVQFRPYRAEAFDFATTTNEFNIEDIVRCWECRNDTLNLRLSETYFCCCCGLTVCSDAVSYTDCPECKFSKGVFYDPLNTSDGLHRGRCLHCDTWVWVWTCNECEGAWAQIEKNAPLACPACQELDG